MKTRDNAWINRRTGKRDLGIDVYDESIGKWFFLFWKTGQPVLLATEQERIDLCNQLNPMTYEQISENYVLQGKCGLGFGDRED